MAETEEQHFRVAIWATELTVEARELVYFSLIPVIFSLDILFRPAPRQAPFLQWISPSKSVSPARSSQWRTQVSSLPAVRGFHVGSKSHLACGATAQVTQIKPAHTRSEVCECVLNVKTRWPTFWRANPESKPRDNLWLPSATLRLLGASPHPAGGGPLWHTPVTEGSEREKKRWLDYFKRNQWMFFSLKAI